jgi:hypothetical protein
MVKRGMQDYRKAIAFTKDKWDLKKNSPIESGTTVDDIIEYVHRKMYLSNLVVIDNDNDEVNLRQKEVDIIVDVAQARGNIEDDEGESDNVDSKLEDESDLDDSKPPYIDDGTDNDATPKKPNYKSGNDNDKRNESEKDDDNESSKNEKDDNNKDGCNEKISCTCNQKSNEYKDDEDDDNDGKNDSESTNDDVNNDDDYNTSDQDDDKESSEDETKDSAKKKRKIIGQKKKKNSSPDDEQVPHEYMFNSYMAYVLWGPFVDI